MKKTPTIYVRDWKTHQLTAQVTPGCEWVLAGEGVPTRKYDGTCVALDTEGNWWARRTVKPSQIAPLDFVLLEKDLMTGVQIGWEPIEHSPWAKQFQDALEHDESLWEEIVVLEGEGSRAGTYELIGPKINGNPEKQPVHLLIRHAEAEVLSSHPDSVTEPNDMVRWYSEIEGIVWHHPDGRTAKLKARDVLFGLPLIFGRRDPEIEAAIMADKEGRA